jgi:hypothetical protein
VPGRSVQAGEVAPAASIPQGGHASATASTRTFVFFVVNRTVSSASCAARPSEIA